MPWAWVPLVLMLAVIGLRFGSVYAVSGPWLLPHGTLRTWEQSNRLYGRIKGFFYANLLSILILLAVTVAVNASLPDAPFRIDDVTPQLWVTCGFLLAAVLLLQVAAGLRDIRLGKQFPGLADSATPPMTRAIAALSFAVPLGLLLWADQVAGSPLFFVLEAAGLLLIVLRMRLYTRFLVKQRVRLPDDDPIAVITREVFERAGLKPRDFIVTPSTAAGGYVLPTGVVAVTTSLAWLLTPAETAAVLLHELSHYRAKDLRRYRLLRLLFFVLIATPIVGIEYLLIPDFHAEVVFPGFLGDALLVALLQALAMGAITRPIEFRCDAAAAEAGYGAEMASALEKLARYMGHPRTWSRFHGLFMSHPSYAERIARLTEPAVESTG